MKANVYQIVTDRIVALLEKGVVPWQKPWDDARMPRNLVSKKPYRGINIFMLLCSGFNSPYWLTYNQAKSLGGQVKKGEHSTIVILWKWLEAKPKEGDDPAKKRKKFPILRYFNVFNVEQCEGIKLPEPVSREPVNVIEKCERIVSEMPNRPAIVTEHGFLSDRACYSPTTDTVTMPEMKVFKSSEGYYATLFHELTHSTGHATRLDRGLFTDFGSDPYSKEELVAEFGASFLCGEAGIVDRVIENSASYIEHWSKQLKDDPELVVKASGAAQKAADYILNRSFNEESEDKTETTESAETVEVAA